MLPRALARSQSTRPISRPVASPTCSDARTLWAPSMPSAGRPHCVAIERRAPLEQLPHVPRPFLDEHAHGRLVAEAVAGRDRVARVQAGRVVGTDGRRDAALRVAGVALGRIPPWSG